MDSVQYDILNDAYKEKAELEKAQELGVITQDELNNRLLSLRNRVRIILGFQPIEE